MARCTRDRVSLAVASGLAGALVTSGLVLTVDQDFDLIAGAASRASSSLPSLPGPDEARSEPQAPGEADDVPGPWSALDPSVEALPASIVERSAPEATESTLLRVVSVVNRDGEPVIKVQHARGPRAAAEALGQAQGSDDVVAVSIDTRVRLDASRLRRVVVVADALRGQQWALDRLRAEAVWSDYSSGAGAVVAVIDTGVAGAHPDLLNQLTAAGMDYVAGTGDGRTDPHGHGTHVAGIIAAARDNNLGIAGLAPRAKVMPIRVLDASGSGWNSNIAKGIIYAVDNGADVINLSLGGTAEDPLTKTAVNYAMSQGAVVVAAAGNDRATNNATTYPAAYPGVLAVASTERQDTSSAFSNTGPYLDIAAPGGSILSTLPGGYGYMSGTSMATPYVAATAALVTDITGGTLTTEQFERQLTASATDLGPSGWDPEFGFGLTNPHQTLCSFTTCGATVTPAPTPVTSPAPSTSTAPAPSQSPTETLAPPSTPTTSPAPPSTTASPIPAPTATPSSQRRPLRLVFTTNGGTVRRGQRVLIGILATFADTGEPVMGRRIMLRGWRDRTITLRHKVTTSSNGKATVRLALRATTRFDLKTSSTATTQAASSATTIRWRVR